MSVFPTVLPFLFGFAVAVVGRFGLGCFALDLVGILAMVAMELVVAVLDIQKMVEQPLMLLLYSFVIAPLLYSFLYLDGFVLLFPLFYL